MPVSRSDKAFNTKLPIDPRLPVTGMERADRKWLLPLGL
jgi:hypothetical protein